jgi:multicomponent Na+:H+ antiporter subunit B
MSEKTIGAQANAGILLYAGIGALCLFLGANFLDYSALGKILPAAEEDMARSHGMLGIEVGVALAVMAIMVGIYANIASRGRMDKGL